MIFFIITCFMVEIIDSDAKFGSSVKIYPENHPSWAILAVFQPISVLIPTFSVKNVKKNFEKLCATFFLNFYNFFLEKIFQRNQPRGKHLKKHLYEIFRFFDFAQKWAETQLKWSRKKVFRGKFSRWIRIWHQNRWFQP